jgi:hypothetical protein
MKLRVTSVFCCGLILLAVPALRGQNPQPNAGPTVTVPTITFNRVWEAYTPQNVDITVQSTGATKYHSSNPLKPPDEKESDTDYTLQFTMSSRTLDRLFRAAKEADYFHGDFTFKKHAVASTGKKILAYADQSRHFATSFDYSDNKAIQDITNLLMGISSTIEHGRKLQFLRRFDKLGLEDELKAMEGAVESHNLEELEIISPTLENIANDPAVLNIARQRAKRLLAKAAAE